MKFSMLPLWAFWQIGSVQASSQLEMGRCEGIMHSLVISWRMCVVGGYFSHTLEGGQMGDNLEIFGKVLGFLFLLCLFFYYICHIHVWMAGLIVHHVGISCWKASFCERHSGSNRTQCMAIMSVVVQYLYSAEVCPND
jgi:hypothetical protein